MGLINWLTVAVTAILALGLHTLDMKFLVEPRQVAALAAQQKQLIATCEADKQITENTSHDLQTKLAALDARLNQLKQLRKPTCVVPVANAAPGHDGPTGNAQLPRQDGITSDALHEFGGDAEKTGIKLDACQGFVRATWQAKGYKIDP